MNIVSFIFGTILVIIVIIIIVMFIYIKAGLAILQALFPVTGCPINSNSTNTGYEINSNCKCPTGHGYMYGMCLPCPTGANSNVTGTLAFPGCYCTTGYSWNSMNNTCV
jgi:hypothetical protein